MTVSQSSSKNPYNELLEQCDNDPQRLQSHYSRTRLSRTTAQKSLLLSPDFSGFTIDPILAKLLDTTATKDHGFVDPRNCLVFWARPPERVRALVGGIQDQLAKAFPSLWLMPPHSLHLTVLEIAHSLPYPTIAALTRPLRPHLASITGYPLTHRARLVMPRVNYDGSAIAVSFLPAATAAATTTTSGTEHDRVGGGRDDDDITTTTTTHAGGSAANKEGGYTYHHLRRDVYDLVTNTAGVAVASRYVAPSAHLTVARFVDQTIHEAGRVGELVALIEGINEGLERECGDQGEWGWTVGEEKGLVCREGTVWYGGGRSLWEGDGF